ncbi:hypothetical protein [Pedobacter sp. BMA]|uniref:hypothetical protein n=1 Tax=Pedobacter sp. BMA TaxID=1663685 RepID=UPI00064A8300|nr:hypothetical protein [Pedobacter sp. BMA]KLT63920.1 hypothetical protein AB669_19515 [Pedobacter sp. BMA]
MAQTSTAQDAIRLLYIFVHGSDPVDNDSQDFAGCFEGKTKLHALDFWVRYPDYLAYQLLNIYEETFEEEYLKSAKEILRTDEPDIRSIPMIRYRFGAYDDISEALSILLSKGLVLTGGEKANGKITSYEFYVTEQAKKLVESIAIDFPILKWYDDRTKLVKKISGNLSGNALKAMQYQHMSYAKTNLGTLIPSIKDEVQSRLTKIIFNHD